jgi:hypothetical protein
MGDTRLEEKGGRIALSSMLFFLLFSVCLFFLPFHEITYVRLLLLLLLRNVQVELTGLLLAFAAI